MAFRFPLAAVLRLREIEEQREERLLSQILQQITQTRDAIAEFDRRIVAARNSQLLALRGGVKAADMHAGYAGLAALAEQRAATEQQLAQWQQLREKQIAVYRAAHQRHELLATMRQRQQALYVAAQAKAEQKMMDDAFLARRPKA